jgi:hypothetical protein
VEVSNKGSFAVKNSYITSTTGSLLALFDEHSYGLKTLNPEP